jgi:hypothetical protein
VWGVRSSEDSARLYRNGLSTQRLVWYTCLTLKTSGLCDQLRASSDGGSGDASEAIQMSVVKGGHGGRHETSRANGDKAAAAVGVLCVGSFPGRGPGTEKEGLQGRGNAGRSQYEGKKGPCRVPLGERVGGRGERALAAPCPEAQAGSGRVKGGGDVSLRDMGV